MSAWPLAYAEFGFIASGSDPQSRVRGDRIDRAAAARPVPIVVALDVRCAIGGAPHRADRPAQADACRSRSAPLFAPSRDKENAHAR